MKRKDVNYKFARELIYGKDLALNNFIDDMLIKTAEMFHYDNLPETLPKLQFERLLQENGFAVVAEHNGKLYAFYGGLGGLPDVYNNPTECVVANPALNLNKTFKIGGDCVLVLNDARLRGLLPTLSKYGVMCNDSEITLNMITNVLRTLYIISAGDNKTKESAEKFLEKLIAGDFSVIGENTFLEGVKVQPISIAGNYIQQMIELHQYLRATAYNEIGLDANWNMKRERLTAGEVTMQSSILLPMLDNMLECRRFGVKQINDMFGTDIKVELSSVWKMQQEAVDNSIQSLETETHIDSEAEKDGVKQEGIDEKQIETENTSDKEGKNNETN